MAIGVAGCGRWDGAAQSDQVGEAQGALVDPMNSPNGFPLRVRWLGVAGVEFEFDNNVFLVDPYFTRTVNNEPPWRLV
ncbi:MAG: hypothetical protein QME94_17230, partial [Anaerolineae bacterium]|nr:hypothetical protein [Anaerolineae bacterium]